MIMAGEKSMPSPRSPLYFRLWRWHFFAGLFCVPLVVLLSLTGSLYLFKPQIEAALESRYDGLRIEGPALPPAAIVAAAEAAMPGSRVKSYAIPTETDSAIRVGLTTEAGDRLAFVHPVSGEVLGTIVEADRLMAVVKSIHGELLMGDNGSLIVELAASWAIVMIATGLYLWWPRGQGLAGVLVIRTGQGKRLFWRDVHAVTGVWVSGAALLLLLTGLPWTGVWGDGFKMVRDVTGTAAIKQDWSRSRSSEALDAVADHGGHEGHEGHSHAVPADGSGANAMPQASWTSVIAQAKALDLAPPIVVMAPSARNQVFVVRSNHPNPAMTARGELSVTSANVLGVEQFGDRHGIDQAVGIGIALHEGRLFGLANQLIGLATALGLIVLSVSSIMMWWARRPKGKLAAPPFPADHRLGPGLVVLALMLGLFLPLLGASIIVIAMLDRVVWPVARRVMKIA